jgi:hypothetical protein
MYSINLRSKLTPRQQISRHSDRCLGEGVLYKVIVGMWPNKAA